MRSKEAYQIFEQSIADYHQKDFIDAMSLNPYDKTDIKHVFYEKNWVDTVQWHLEDIIRDVDIDAQEALKIKRRIDHSNQIRTDIVENIDSFFLKHFQDVTIKPDAKINTESPAWAFDRLSILALKIYHMKEEANRSDASENHKKACHLKLMVLEEQRADLTMALDDLLNDIEKGNKYMKVYKQMKMYNDESLNPVLRARKK
jgi:hypothetical protein